MPSKPLEASSSTPTVLKFKRLENGTDLALPEYKTEGAAGMDICAAEDVTLMGYDHVVVPTGFAAEIPPGYELQCRPRSGLAAKGVTILNAPGTIDEDYRGEIKVILGNTSSHVRHFTRGERIAQLVLAPVTRLPIVEVDELSDTIRGTNGFGSTGQ